MRRLSFDDRVLELGSGMGFISTLCTTLFRGLPCTTVEANPDLIPTILGTHAANRVSPEIVYGLATDKPDDRSCLHVHENHLFSSATPIKSAKSISVRTVSVNDLLKRTGANFLIMDIEGGEEQVILGTDLKQVDKLLVEFHRGLLGEEKVASLIRHLESTGFREDRSVSTRSKKLFLKNSNGSRGVLVDARRCDRQDARHFESLPQTT